MALESVYRLWELVKELPDTEEYSLKDRLHNLACCLERDIRESQSDIVERCMELPVDATGELIRIGDVVGSDDWVHDREVIGYAVIKGDMAVLCKKEGVDVDHPVWHRPYELSLVKPDPVKELLIKHNEERVSLSNLYRASDDMTSDELIARADAIDSKYADLIQEAVSAG